MKNYPKIQFSIICLLFFIAVPDFLYSQNVWKYDLDILPGASNISEYLPIIKDKKVCILSNQTGIIPAIDLSDKKNCKWYKKGERSNGIDNCEMLFPYTHIVDTLKSLGVNITCIMSPEHGFRGNADAGEKVTSSIDEKTGIEIRSLYGTNIPDEQLMQGFDILVFDLQDVGVRFYTYYVTMVKMMAKCAKFGKPMIVLDRPNPIGFYVDGPILELKYKSGVGGLPIPIAYGMTIGELAFMANEKGWLEWGKDSTEKEPLKCDLTVVKCINYTHSKHYRLPIKPSPNLPNMRSIYLYPSTCYFEGTDVSLGRGTSYPFQVYGSPKMKGYKFSFVPKSVAGAKNPPLLGEKCYGVDLRKRPSISQINSEQITLKYIIDAYNGCGKEGDKFFKRMFELEIGQSWVREAIKNGNSAQEIKNRWAVDVEQFKRDRERYLLYD